MSEFAGSSWENEQDSPANDSTRPDEERGGYLGFVAHEVRNPLSTALWTAELLARMAPEERGGARGEKLSAMCLRSLARVRLLIEDHFLCERLDAGGLPTRPEPIALSEVVAAVLAKKPIEDPERVELAFPEGATVDVDRPLLERALEGVLAQAGRSGGPVRLESRDLSSGFELHVVGDPAGPEALLDPRKGSPSDQKGRALALPASRRAMQALGGSLEVRDGAYVLTLPVMDATTQTP